MLLVKMHFSTFRTTEIICCYKLLIKIIQSMSNLMSNLMIYMLVFYEFQILLILIHFDCR